MTPSALSSPQPFLRVVGLRKTYPSPQGALEILKGVELTLEAGASVALMGESGSGKSTLLHLVGCLDRPDSGEIWLDGTLVSALPETEQATVRQRAIGVVFQQFNLIPSLDVRDNLAFQARISDRLEASWLDELTERLGLSSLLSRYPEQLSGGQQQRVAIGRALAVRPRLLLADEPTGNLDEATGDAVLNLALELVAETGCSFMMVTHSARLAAKLGRQALLSSGTIVEDGVWPGRRGER